MRLIEELNLKSDNKRKELLAISEKSLPKFIEDCNVRMRKSAELGKTEFEITTRDMVDKLKVDGLSATDPMMPDEVWSFLKSALRDSICKHYSNEGFGVGICKNNGSIALRWK